MLDATLTSSTRSWMPLPPVLEIWLFSILALSEPRTPPAVYMGKVSTRMPRLLGLVISMLLMMLRAIWRFMAVLGPVDCKRPRMPVARAPEIWLSATIAFRVGEVAADSVLSVITPRLLSVRFEITLLTTLVDRIDELAALA